MSNLQQFQANALVYVMIDDFPSNKLNDFNSLTHPKKTIYQLTSFANINTAFDVEAGGGTLTMSLNDKDKRFWKYYPIYQNLIRNFGTHEISFNNYENGAKGEKETVQSVIYNDREVIAFQKFLNYYSQKDDSGVYKDLSKLANDFTNEIKTTREAGGILAPALAPQNMVWAFLMGRDGYWYPAFTGLIQSVRPSYTPKETPTIDITARTFDRIFEYSYIVTGQLPIVPVKNRIQTSVQNQGGESGYGSIAWVNRLADKKIKEIIKECIETCNLFFSRYMVNSDSGKDSDPNRIGGQNIFTDVFNMRKQETKTETTKDDDEIEGKEPIESEVPIKEEDKNEAYDYRYFKVRKIFGFGEDETAPYWGGKTAKTGYKLNDLEAWQTKKYFWNEPIQLSDLYKGEELYDMQGKQVNPDSKFTKKNPRDLFQVKISEDFIDNSSLVKAFQILIRTNISLFNVDKMSIKDVFDILKKCTLGYFYCDTDGSFKVERPYFDTWLENYANKISTAEATHNTIPPIIETERATSLNSNNYAGMATTPSNITVSEVKKSESIPYEMYEVPPEAPADYDLRYIVSRKDISYLSDSYEESETNIITRGFIQSKFDYGILEGSSSSAVIKGVEGVSESSYFTIAKYGDRQITFSPIAHENLKYLGKNEAYELMNAYALANKLIMDYKARPITITFDQRPDLQLNRNMIFLDLGLIFLITKISQNYDTKSSTLKTTVTGNFTRPIGSFIYNPYFYKFDGSTLKKWTLEDLIIPKKVGTLINGKQPPEYLKEFDAKGTYNYIADKFPGDYNNKVLCLCIRARNVNNIKGYTNWDYFKFVWKKDEDKGVDADNLVLVEMSGYSGTGVLDYANSNNISDGQTSLSINVNRNSYIRIDFDIDPINISDGVFLKSSGANSTLYFTVDGSLNQASRVLYEDIVSNKLGGNEKVPPILLGDNIITPNYTDNTKILDEYKFKGGLKYTDKENKQVDISDKTVYINTLNMYLGKEDNDEYENWQKIYTATKSKAGMLMMIDNSEYVEIKNKVNGTDSPVNNPFTSVAEELAFVAGKIVRGWNRWALTGTGLSTTPNRVLPLPNHIKENDAKNGFSVYNDKIESELKDYYGHRKETFLLKKNLTYEEKIKELGNDISTYRFGLPYMFRFSTENPPSGYTKEDGVTIDVNKFANEYFQYQSPKQLEIISAPSWGLKTLTDSIYNQHYSEFIDEVLRWQLGSSGEIIYDSVPQAVNNLSLYSLSPSVMKCLIYTYLLSTYTQDRDDNNRKSVTVDNINKALEVMYSIHKKTDNVETIIKYFGIQNNKLMINKGTDSSKSKTDLELLNKTQSYYYNVYTQDSDCIKYNSEYEIYSQDTIFISTVLFFFKFYRYDGSTLWTNT